MALSEENKIFLETLKPITDEILDIDIQKNISSYNLKMKIPRGAGKRFGNTVKGAMGGWYGTERREVVDFSEYKNDFEDSDFRMMCIQYSGRIHNYIRARKFGLEHRISIAFAMFFSLGMLEES